jgi:hypothetical protein
MVRGELLVLLGDDSVGQTRTDLERAIAPLGGRIDRGVDLIELYSITFPEADTLSELEIVEKALERLGFWVTRSYTGQLFER